jgi:hypothetical protein
VEVIVTRVIIEEKYVYVNQSSAAYTLLKLCSFEDINWNKAGDVQVQKLTYS